MPNRNVIVFWTGEDNHAWIQSELFAGRLRQGWGPKNTQIIENGRLASFEMWSRRFSDSAKKNWDWNTTPEQLKTRYGILSRMATLQRGDLLVVPRMPSNEEFTIAQVTTGYEFDDRHFYPPTLAPNTNDFAHVINVDRNNLATYSYGKSSETRSVASKFRNYRSAVNNVRNDEYAKAIIRLFDESHKHS